MFSHSYWSDIWSRLGPRESYCAFGLALFVIAFERLLNLPRPRWYWSVVLALGVFVSAGAKENFVVLLIPISVLAYFMRRDRKLSGHFNSAVVFSVVYIGIIVLELLMAFSTTKSDFYANPVTLSSQCLATRAEK